jgi:DNA-binding MarR family transcriptional regulator
MTHEDPWLLMTGVWRLLSTVTVEAAPALDALGLQPRQFYVLSSIDAHPSPSALARATQSPPATVTSALKALEARGFVERSSVPGDLRRFAIRLTPTGRAALARGEAALRAAFGRRLAVLSPEDRRQMPAMIQAMLDVGSEEGRDAP